MAIKKVKLPNGETRWELRCYENGRGSKRVTRRFDRRSDAEAFEDKFRVEKRERKMSPVGIMAIEDRTFQEEAEYWLNDRKMRFTASHLKRVEGVLREILPDMGLRAINQMTPEYLSRFQQQQKKYGLENATVNRKTEVICAILNFSNNQRRIPYNPAVGFRKLAKSEEEMLFWEPEEAKSFLDFVNNKYPPSSEMRWKYVVYLLALTTGLRAGEIWGLKVIDRIPQRNVVWCRRQFERVTKEFNPTKGKGNRQVPCSDLLNSELVNLEKSQKLLPGELYFRSKSGTPVCHDNYIKWTYNKDIEEWGGRKIRFHDLRHTATTFMLARGVKLETVSRICGHKDIQTTMIYAHLLSTDVTNAAKEISFAGIFASKMGGVGQISA